MAPGQFEKAMAALERIADALERLADAKESEEGPHVHTWNRENNGGVYCVDCGEKQ